MMPSRLIRMWRKLCEAIRPVALPARIPDPRAAFVDRRVANALAMCSAKNPLRVRR